MVAELGAARVRLVPGDSLSASAGDEERLSLECHGHCVGRIVGVSVGLPQIFRVRP